MLRLLWDDGHMQWLIAILLVAVIAAAVLVARGRLGEQPEPVDDRPGPDVPAGGALSGADLRAARFAVVPRGYSMVQVDALLARLADQLDQSAAQESPHSPGDEAAEDAAPEAVRPSWIAARATRGADDEAALRKAGDAGAARDAG